MRISDWSSDVCSSDLKFLGFLTGKLRAEIGKRYKIDPDRQSLFGHSFGGLFALHALYARPGAFQSIVAASPSLEWNVQDLLREESAFAARLADGNINRTSRLMLVAGDQDRDDDRSEEHTSEPQSLMPSS